MRVAVIGHVEWTTIAELGRVPHRGEVVHAAVTWEGPAGGGAVAAVRMAELTGGCVFFTALGDDEAGERSRSALKGRGVEVLAVTRTAPTRTAVSLVDATRERTTVTLGPRLHPEAQDPLPWDDLAGFDAVFFAAGAPGVLRSARAARSLVVTTRELETVAAAGVRPDAMVGSARDGAERYRPELLAETPGLVVVTDGAHGGTFTLAGEPPDVYPPVRVDGPLLDTYGVGDTFAAALTVGLGANLDVPAALELAARCGSACLTGTGPYGAGTSVAALRMRG
ncbi:PfkB family carbohydrate kinase [Micromonospora sp. M61]|uniref:PfkB family carbohydrate kinase n=1 Tax=Micromonospora sp. M61 TaxID=2824890 RepID=UPI001B38E22A|nr:PfkB family carbohydrate kinase [Micromonospora sp. M61]MBQ0977918.1 hypothetical protein [Micromonospora sp. M61]